MSILKNILLSSLGVLLNTNTNVKAESINIINDEINNFDKIINFNPKKDLSLKLKLNLNSSSEWSIDSHRSHRSHSSHRSHYSSQGGHYSHFSSSTGNSNNNSKSNSYNNNNSKSNSYNNSSNTGSTYKSKAINSQSLGDRTIYKGMKGTDVTELVNILVKKNYLKFNDGSTKAYGTFEFDEAIYNAVKQFQIDNGLNADGIVGSTTVYYLKK